MNKKKRLGRGLEALLNSAGPEADVATEQMDATEQSSPSIQTHDEQSTSDTMQLSVYEIDDNPFQPRREFSEPEIASLSESLKEHDMLQPILVRVIGDRYQLISGERRLRAAIAAGWSTIPARVRQADDRLVAELAIVENLQRKDLNPVEKALSFRRYIDEHQCTQEELAGRLKIDRSTLTNLIRLLELPAACQDSLRKGLITAGHARALLPLGDEHLQLDFCNRIQRDGWSVRQTEREVSELLERELSPGMQRAKKAKTLNPQIEALQQRMKMALGTKIEIKNNSRNKGKIIIHFANANEFERLNQLLMEQASSQQGSTESVQRNAA